MGAPAVAGPCPGRAPLESLLTWPRPLEWIPPTALMFSRTETFLRPIKLGEARSIHPDMTSNGYLQTTKRVSEHVFVSFLNCGSGTS